jgi:hypothetical protein
MPHHLGVEVFHRSRRRWEARPAVTLRIHERHRAPSPANSQIKKAPEARPMGLGSTVLASVR